MTPSFKTICLVIGHSSGAQGAANPETGLTEWVYNSALANEIMRLFLPFHDEVDCRLIHRGAEYKSGTELAQAIDAINDHEPHLTVALHCNAWNQKRAGHAVIHHPSGKAGAELAPIFMAHIATALGNRDRRIRRRKNLGLLNKTRAPALILEPFFIDNPKDCANGVKRRLDLAHGIYGAITLAFKEGIV